MNKSSYQASSVGVPLGGTGGFIPSVSTINNPVAVDPLAEPYRKDNRKNINEKNGFGKTPTVNSTKLTSNKNVMIIAVILLLVGVYKYG